MKTKSISANLISHGTSRGKIIGIRKISTLGKNVVSNKLQNNKVFTLSSYNARFASGSFYPCTNSVRNFFAIKTLRVFLVELLFNKLYNSFNYILRGRIDLFFEDLRDNFFNYDGSNSFERMISRIYN